MSTPSTGATRAFATFGLPFTVLAIGHVTSVEEAAAAAGLPLGALLRTIVVRRGEGDYLLVVAPADRQFDWTALRAHLGVSRLSLPDAQEAQGVTGYERGTITPFGTLRPLPVLIAERVMTQPRVAIGGGAHGVQIQLAPRDLLTATAGTLVAL